MDLQWEECSSLISVNEFFFKRTDMNTLTYKHRFLSSKAFTNVSTSIAS